MIEGLVVTTHGRHCMVEAPQLGRLICHSRGKKNQVVVGDKVLWNLTHPQSQEGIIEKVEPRRNLLFRQDLWRSKSFAANLDLLLIWLACEPQFSEAQLARALIAADQANIPVCIVLNKTDLPSYEQSYKRLQIYQQMGYTVLALSLSTQPGLAIQQLWPYLENRFTLVLGPSGSGKSTLINTLIPDAKAQTSEISSALNSGKHTTTTTQLYWLNETKTTALIDSPGFQEFGLHHLSPDQIIEHMPDLKKYLGECKFQNCQHQHEPGCGIKKALESQFIHPNRYKFYLNLREELTHASRKT